MPAEDKPLTSTIFHLNLQRYCITFDEHSGSYDFYNPPDINEEFFSAFEKHFVPRQNLWPVLFKCTFTIVNRQTAPAVGFVEVTYMRVWTTSVYEGFILLHKNEHGWRHKKEDYLQWDDWK